MPVFHHPCGSPRLPRAPPRPAALITPALSFLVPLLFTLLLSALFYQHYRLQINNKLAFNSKAPHRG